ncbi:ribulose-phosphate 3-epimerase [bacterium]|nr:ribulose-phosphate 3-epimerase [bacterium]
MVKIAPSILTCDFSDLTGEVKKMEKEKVDMLHLDIMDGHFVPNLSFGPMVVKSLRPKTNLFFDVHLMIENADEFLLPFSQAGADLITVHIESCKDLGNTINKIKSLGKGVGVCLNPDTPIEKIIKFLPELDLVMLMSVFPGFGGQKFICSVLKKIEKLKAIIEKEKLNLDIEVDGGINIKTAAQAVSSGASILVVGSALYQAEDLGETIKYLKNLSY